MASYCVYLVPIWLNTKTKSSLTRLLKTFKKKNWLFLRDLGKTLGPRACFPIVPAVWLPKLTSRNDADKQKENNKILLFHLR